MSLSFGPIRTSLSPTSTPTATARARSGTRLAIAFGLASLCGLSACDDTSAPRPDARAGEADLAEDATDGGVDQGAPIDQGAPDGGALARLGLFVRTDGTTTSLAAVDLINRKVLGRLAGSDGNLAIYASGGRAFLLDRRSDRVGALDKAEPWKIAWTTATPASDGGAAGDDGGAASDDGGAANARPGPARAVVVAGTKGYVLRGGSNRVEVIDLASGSTTAALDLAPFVDANDADGIVDAVDGAYDTAAGRIYLVLQRTGGGGGPSRCLDVHPLIVGFDAASNQAVDLNGAAAGSGIELQGALPANAPGALVVNFAAKKLLVLDSGCIETPDGGGPQIARAGVEEVDLQTGTASWKARSNLADPLTGLLWLDGAHAFVQTPDPAPIWREWDPTKASFGAVASALPAVAVAGGGGRVVGLTERAAIDGGTTLDVVSYDVATGALAFVATEVLSGSDLQAAGAAIP